MEYKGFIDLGSTFDGAPFSTVRFLGGANNCHDFRLVRTKLTLSLVPRPPF